MSDLNSNFSLINNKRSATSEIVQINEIKKIKVENNRKSKKMFAILMMYSGVGYFGMARQNSGVKTIENELFRALFEAEIIDKNSFEIPSKIRFQKASKTDKNVSACGQVCSLKIPDEDNLTEKINSHLPEDIRIIDVFRTTKTFQAKSFCKNRTYRYITPSFAFADKEINDNELLKYRITHEILEKINKTLLNYKGTHNYHNFTSGKSSSDKSCQRYMLEIKCELPFVRDDIEYVTITINGQSFMLHQIRKMLGLCMAVVRGFCDETVFERVYSLNKVDIPKAPGLGLILDKVNYDFYNSRHCLTGERTAIEWNKYHNQISEFRESHIYSHIYKIEKEENSMLCWLETLARHTYLCRLKDEEVKPLSDNLV